jgi:serine/threonine protein kinase
MGPYEIVALLGSGGMGDVYRATDTHLGRQVAIKVLPDAVASDPERLARFEREARTLASLNHPNIATVHGLEKSEGTHALVMELVEGPTLAELLVGRGRSSEGPPPRTPARWGGDPPAGGSKDSPLPIAEALAIARQIAEALESAHEHGIVHRDLKPANVKVRPDGMVKVLDFGLAKALAPDAAAAPGTGLSMSPTITAPGRGMTQMGVILGTAAYMSPEQARGGQADRRADVWAFGCVVYEMLAGRPVFDGKTVSDVLAGVLRADPSWERLPGALHPRLRLMLERCLARELRDRYQGIADARVDIEAAMSDPSGAVVASAPRIDQPARSLARRCAPVVVSAAAGAAIAVVATLALNPDTATESGAVRFNLSPPDGAMFDSSGAGIPFAVSPDGRAIAFVTRSAGESRLWIQSLDAERAQPLQGTEGASSPFWSPDSAWVAFYAGGSLKKVRRVGGEPQTIVATRWDGGGGSAWSTNGTILFKSGRFESAWLGVSAEGGPVSQVTRLEGDETTHIWPAFLPDGIRFVHRVWGSRARNGIYLASLDGRPPRLLLAASNDRERGLAYVPGFLLFVRDSVLVARRFDEERLVVLDEELRLVDDIPACCGHWDPWSVSPTGVLAYWRNSFGYDAVLRWYARDGVSTDAIGAPARYWGFSLSPDDRRIAFARFHGVGLRDILVRDVLRDTETRLTFDGDSFSPVWSRNGNDVAFSSARGIVPDVWVAAAAGGGSDQARRVTEQTASVDAPGAWAPNGTEIVYTALNPDGQSDLRRVLLPAKKEESLPLNGPFDDVYPRLSPDGRWIAYVTSASGRPEVWVASHPSGTNRVPVSRNGGLMPEWRMSDGGELYYVSLDQQLMAASVRASGSGIEVGLSTPLVRLSDLVPIPWLERNSYAPSRDGRRFLVEVLAPGARQPPLQVILNWPALLRDRASSPRAGAPR